MREKRTISQIPRSQSREKRHILGRITKFKRKEEKFCEHFHGKCMHIRAQRQHCRIQQPTPPNSLESFVVLLLNSLLCQHLLGLQNLHLSLQNWAKVLLVIDSSDLTSLLSHQLPFLCESLSLLFFKYKGPMKTGEALHKQKVPI